MKIEPPTPPTLTAAEREVFVHTFANLAMQGRCELSDSPIIARYARLRLLLDGLAEDIRLNGTVQTLESGREMSRPQYQQMLSTARELANIERVLRLTPMHSKPAKTATPDAEDSVLGRMLANSRSRN